jgi:hypothetical protein
MTQDALYRCWIVPCKTKGCSTGIVLHVIAEDKPTQTSATVYILRECRDFRETCPECGQEHTYCRGDIEPVNLPNQNVGDRSRSFVEATTPLPAETEEKSDGKN